MAITNPNDTATLYADLQPIKDKANRVLNSIDAILSQAGIVPDENGLYPPDTPIINRFMPSQPDGLSQDIDPITGQPAEIDPVTGEPVSSSVGMSIDRNSVPNGEAPAQNGEGNLLQSLHDKISKLRSELQAYATVEDVKKTLNSMIPKIANVAAARVPVPKCDCGGHNDGYADADSPEAMAGEI